MFFVLTFLVAIVSVTAPLLLLRFAVRRWHIQPKIFWKSGLAGIVIGLVVLGVTINIDGAFPSFVQLPVIVQALILGVFSGLLVELGKFLVLDRMMPMVRTRESALVFGLGWAGVGILFMGFILALGTFGMQNLANTQDLRSTLPNADEDQIKFLEESQKQLQLLVNGSPLKALTPLLENISIVLMDMATVLLIVFGLKKKKTYYTWYAVGMRTVLSTSLFFVVQGGIAPLEFVYAGGILLGGFMLFFMQKKFPPAAV